MSHIFGDTMLLFRRSVTHTFRSPEILVGVTVSPIMFVLMFRYVFGGAIEVAGTSYVNYLMAGIFVQAIAFGALTTAISLAYDLSQGIVERFFTLPMSRPAIVIGRTFADCLRAVLTLFIMVVVGVIVGYRPEGTPTEYAAAVGILLLFSFAISWVGALMAIFVPNVEALQQLSFIIILPLTFVSSAFVEPSTMPAGLQEFAENQPVSQVVDAVRSLTTDLPADGSIAASVLWSLGILAVAVPMVGWAFRRVGSR
ncbi:MAG: ABC transporter permease [Thermoleophilaceae bacterium]|nr:ABC transporter permease [Thermoleophilaceae bacterium]